MGEFNRIINPDKINKNNKIRFTFNGKSYVGRKGDTLAAGLLANNVFLVGRSFKYHRPRGIIAAGAEEPGALVQLEQGSHTQPNIRATQIELYDNLIASSVNVWPSVDTDVSAINGLFSRIFTAGFYNKTFMWPRSFWMKLYEPVIRRAAGWGKAPQSTDPDIYDHIHDYPDILVVGGGPAGLSAALVAARAGARVVLVDEGAELGGGLRQLDRIIDQKPSMEWVESVKAELSANPNVKLLSRTVLFGYYDQNYLVAVEHKTDHLPLQERAGKVRQRTWHFRAKRVVLATGAHERPIVFSNNDKPGVMLAGSVLAYLERYQVRCGSEAVYFTNNDSAYESALRLHESGATVKAIIDTRTEVKGELPAKAEAAGIEVIKGSAISKALGRKTVKAIEVRKFSQDKSRLEGAVRRIPCNLVAMSGGWSPVVHLFSQSGGKLTYNSEKACYLPIKIVQNQYVAGSCNGDFLTSECIESGVTAGREASTALGLSVSDQQNMPIVEEVEDQNIEACWMVPGENEDPQQYAKHFVDFQNDTTATDIHLAVKEGFESSEHIKRYTLTGFGTDQGKTSNINALGILSQVLKKPISELPTTTFRPPYTPVSYGALAGRHIGKWSDTIRVTSIHDWHVKNGALFENVGQWHRPWYYPRNGETMQQSLNRECLAVRQGVGVLDASTLGKIEIKGPDAAEFLNLVYTNAWSKLGVGRVRYGLMCREDGMVFDDGTTARLADDHFLMTTTTGNAALVLDWLEEYLQTEWPHLKVFCTSVTEQWSTISIAGPKSRRLLQKLAPHLNLAADDFPFMSFKTTHIDGLECRIFRISFTGELSYEINVPWHAGQKMWDLVMEAGEEFGIAPYGTETMHILRAEKGFIIVGQETDGTMTPQDLGMDWIVSKKKDDFIGKRSFTRADTGADNRKQLVGLLTDNPKEVLPEGAQLVFDRYAPKPMPMVGHVTSSYYSATLERSIALAVVRGGLDKMGERLFAPLEHTTIGATITSPVFYDPEGDRLDGEI
ncbi:sarcosine oxidase subunit alpha family protein [Sneathiella glossodoripedis]|uniref:sarcosine oxidase subunit alpha family protein n=1 Tax=Sneathiella glossodoripedis TaxID=418853 RepID=UPI00046EF7F6|nr:sarcosine oxidase subunit alpha family protein [Sneathiella glossodoripedis]